MAESAVPKVPRDGSLVVKDGTATPNTYTVQYSDAVQYTGTQAAPIHVFNRGTRVYTRLGNDGIPSISFTAILPSFTDGTDVTVLDAMLKTGAASGWTKVLSTCEDYNVTLSFSVEGTDHGDDTDHTIECTGVRVTEYVITEGEPNTVTFSAEVLGTTTRTGPT